MNRHHSNSSAFSFCLAVFIFAILLSGAANASWPTQLYAGKPLVVDTTADEEAVAVAEAPDGSLRLLTRSWGGREWWYFYLTYSLYALDREGNLLWDPHQAQLKYFTELALDPYTYYPVIMKVGSQGETWIVWESYVESATGESSPEPLNNSIRAVRFDAEGNPSPSQFIAVEQGPIHMLKHPRHVEVLDDGGMILLWQVRREYGDEDIPWEVRAQKYTAQGNEVWTPGGVILDSTYDYYQRKGTSEPAASDGEGGLLLSLGNELQRLKSDGNLAWPRSKLVIDGMKKTTGTQMLQMQPGAAAVFAYGDTIDQWVVAYDTAGSLNIGEGYGIPISVLGYNSPPTEWGSGFAKLTGHYRLLQFDHDLSPKFTEDPGEFFPWGDQETYIWLVSMGQYGIRFSIHQSPMQTGTINENVIIAQDTSCQEIWRSYISQDSTHAFRTLPWLAPDGTTFIFWSASGLKDGKRDIFANTVDLAGNWGHLQTASTAERTIIPLPTQITLNTWPNPTNGMVQFTWSGKGQGRFVLFDLLGRQLLQGEIAGSTVRLLDMKDLSSGTYVLRVMPLYRLSGMTTQTRRIVLVK